MNEKFQRKKEKRPILVYVPYVRFPAAGSPVERDAAVLRAPRPRPTPALLHWLRHRLPQRNSASIATLWLGLAKFYPDPVRPGESVGPTILLRRSRKELPRDEGGAPPPAAVLLLLHHRR